MNLLDVSLFYTIFNPSLATKTLLQYAAFFKSEMFWNGGYIKDKKLTEVKIKIRNQKKEGKSTKFRTRDCEAPFGFCTCPFLPGALTAQANRANNTHF